MTSHTHTHTHTHTHALARMHAHTHTIHTFTPPHSPLLRVVWFTGPARGPDPADVAASTKNSYSVPGDNPSTTVIVLAPDSGKRVFEDEPFIWYVTMYCTICPRRGGAGSSHCNSISLAWIGRAKRFLGGFTGAAERANHSTG